MKNSLTKKSSLKKQISSAIVVAMFTMQSVLANPDGCIIGVSSIGQCHIGYTLSNVEDVSTNGGDVFSSSGSISSGSAELTPGVNEVWFSPTQQFTLASGTVSDSSTGVSVFNGTDNVDIKTALHAKQAGGFTGETIKKITLNSGIPGSNITLKTVSGAIETSVIIPDNTQIFAPSSWNGKITPPRKKSGTFKSGFSTLDAVEVGSTGETLIFDKPIKVTLDAISDNVFYSNNNGSAWTEITNTCSDANDSASAIFPNECYYKDTTNNQTIIWTYHFTQYGVFTPVSGGGLSGTGDLSLSANIDIIEGAIDFGAPDSLSFPNIEISSDDQVLTISSGTGYFWVEDLKSASGGYTAYIYVDNLQADGGTKIISKNNLTVTVTGGIIKMAGSEDTNVVVPSATSSSYIPFISTNSAHIIQRTVNSYGLVGKYGVSPTIQITIPKYQSIGSYTGTITYTVGEI